MKNLILKILCCVCICACCLTTGCSDCNNLRRRQTFYEQGDFRYAILPIDARSEEERYIVLDGLTEEGKTKQRLVIPEEINGISVTHLSQRLWMSYFGQLESEKLESVYVMGVSDCYENYTFGGAPRLEKIVLQKAVKWSEEGYYSVYSHYPSGMTYVPSYAREDGELKGVRYANLSYMYNYANAENEGYYWVDNFDYGTEIGFLPENPEREGYIFSGWYREPECVNEWDFGRDRLPERVLGDDGEEEYRETKLYAKWYVRGV